MAPLSPHTPRTPPPPLSPLRRLPEELLQSILDFLRKRDLQALNLASKWCRECSAPRIWRHVELCDCRTAHTAGGPVRSTGVGNVTATVGRIPAGAYVESDEHDDAPLVRKLVVLATTPWIAAQVQTVTHRCHLVPPAIFNELPRTPFSSQTLSIDPRTICFVRMAVCNMVHVNTLRIIFGHPKLTEALLRCFFAADREHKTPIRRLWLENVRINEGLELQIESHKYGLPLRLDFSGLESIRLRRLPLRGADMSQNERMTNRSAYVYARGRTGTELQNGLGGHYVTSINTVGAEVVMGHEQLEKAIETLSSSSEAPPTEAEDEEEWPLDRLMKASNQFDDAIYDELAQEVELPEEVINAAVHSYKERAMLAYRDRWPDLAQEDFSRIEPKFQESVAALFRSDVPTATQSAMGLFRHAAPTLTSLNLDWILTVPLHRTISWDDYQQWLGWYHELFSLRFPNLRAFQYRNAVVKETILPPSIYLLDHCGSFTSDEFERNWIAGTRNLPRVNLGLKPLEFIEAHPNLQCLAWPMDQFFSSSYRTDITSRVQKVVGRLGLTLTDLRVDTLYSGHGEYQSEEGSVTGVNMHTLLSRRRFMTSFAAHMRTLTSIKMEGGMPRDERRETLRALRHCPLDKIVLIGVCSPIGNTWGLNGQDMTEELSPDELDFLEAEDKSAVHALGHRPLDPPPPQNTPFEPQYQWEGAAPMLHTLASHHSATVRELKFCGYKGSAVLYDPTPITSPMLAPLKHCHNLESLILSFWLSTTYEDHAMDDEVIASWLHRRDASSTSLVSLVDDEPGSWGWHMRTKYTPEALAWRVANFVGAFLSEKAKGRSGGVHVRASFCLGDWGGIFDVDCWVGKGGLGSDVCLGFRGPREEMEEGRRTEKLETRRWF